MIFKKNILLIVFLFAFTHLYSQSVNVPLNYWGYGFIERCEAKGLVSTYELRQRPMTRESFAALIKSVEKQLQQKLHVFSSIESQLLDQLKSDFSNELNITPSEPHLITYSEKNSRFFLDALASQAIISKRGDQYHPEKLLSETTLGAILRGNLGKTIGFYADAQNTITRGEEDVQEEDENFKASQGTPVIVSGANIIRDQAIAYLVFEKPWLRIQAGRQRQRWGPAYRGNLAISENMAPADMIHLSTRMKNFAFSSFHAFLRDDLGAKYLAAHRLDIKIIPGFMLGLCETLIYAGRDVEPAYLNPLMPYHVAEHHLGDRDNNAMSIDATLTLIPAATLYGEFFIDDMTTTKSLTRYYGNKFAFTVGGLYTDPLGFKNTNIRLEYSRVEPYVYTHWDSLNIYTHAGASIGHWLLPNSDVLFAQFAQRLSRDIKIRCSWQHIRHGKGKRSTLSRPETGESKSFLQGIKETKHFLTFKVTNQIRRDFYVSLSYTYSKSKNLNNIYGKRSVNHLARFELSLNY